jgi:hypothetical protein
MAIEKRINIKVNTGKSDEELGKLEKSFKDVDKAAEKTNKSVDDVAGNGGAIAILDQLTGGLATRFKDAYEASRLFNGGLKGVRTALIATGIGAFVIALGLVVAYWDDIVEFIEGANKKLETQNGLIKTNQDLLKSDAKLLEAEEQLLKSQGKSLVKIRKERLTLAKLQLNLLKTEAENLSLQLEKEKSLGTQVGYWESILISAKKAAGFDVTQDLDVINARNKARIAESELKLEVAQENALKLEAFINGLVLDPTGEGVKKEDTVIEDKEDPSIKAEKDRLAEIKKLDEKLRNEIKDQDAQTRKEKLELELQRRQEDLDNLVTTEEEKTELQLSLDIIKFNKREELRKTQAEETAANKKIADDKEAADKQKAADKEKIIEEVLSQQKLDIRTNVENLIGTLAKRGSALAKSLAISQIVRQQVASVSETISATTVANAKAVAASPLTVGQPFVTINTLQAATGIAAGLAGAGKSIKSILSDSKTPQGGNPSGGGGGGGAPSAPSFNLVQGTGANQIAEGLAGQNQPLKAFVVSSDVSNAQSLDRNIIENSSL